MTQILFKPAGDTLERITYETDLQTSRNGTESRISRRLYPEYRIEQSYTQGESYNDGIQAALEATAGQVVELPLHHFTAAKESAIQAGLSADTRRAYRTPGGLIIATAEPGIFTYEAPVADAIITDTITTKHRSGNLAQVKAAYRLLNFKETFSSSLDAPLVNDFNLGLIPLFTFKHNFTNEIDESLTQDSKDFTGDGGGYIALTRYTKKSQAIKLTLVGALEIAKLRAFFAKAKGRAKPFKLEHPLTGALETYRFASDALEISYKSPELAEASISIIKL